MSILSLGSAGGPIAYQFDSPFTLVSQGAGYFGGGPASLPAALPDAAPGQRGQRDDPVRRRLPVVLMAGPDPGVLARLHLRHPHGGVPRRQRDGRRGPDGHQRGELDRQRGHALRVSRHGRPARRRHLVVVARHHRWPGPEPAVTITATDGTQTSTADFALVVDNVAPTATLGNDGPVLTGAPATVSPHRRRRSIVCRPRGRAALRVRVRRRLAGGRHLRDQRH